MSGKLSGAWFKKRRKEREESTKKAKGSLEKYSTKPNNTSVLKEEIDNESPSTSGDKNQLQPQECPINVVEMDITDADATNELAPEKSSLGTVMIDYADPASWDTLNISRKTLLPILVEYGPDQVKGKFPKGPNNRKFSDFHYRRRLPNGEDVYRDYLQYSKSTDQVFCYCCKYLVFTWPKWL